MKTNHTKLNPAWKVFVTLFLFGVCPLMAQPAALWIKTYNNQLTNGSDHAEKTIVDANGNIFVAGTTSNPNDNYDIMILKYNPSGNLLWSRSYNFAGYNGGESADDIKVDNSGNVYVSGRSSRDVNSYDAVILKYNSLGTLVFAKRFNRSLTTDRKAIGGPMVLMGNYIYLGSTFVHNNYHEYGIVRFSMNGDSVSYNQLAGENGPDISKIIGLVADGNNSIYTAGSHPVVNEGLNMSIAKVEFTGPNSVVKWLKNYGGSSHGNDYPRDIKLGPDGNVFVFGESYQNNQGIDMLLLKYGRDDGVIMWEKRYNDALVNQNEFAVRINFDNNANIFVSGYGNSLSTYYDALTLKYSPAGTLLWIKKFNYGTDYKDYVSDAVTDDFGNIYVSVHSNKFNGSITQFETLKYGSNGTLDWMTEYTGFGNTDAGQTLNIDNLGNIIFTGAVYQGASSHDILLIKYGSTIGIQQISNETPSHFELGQNYPNPFNPVTNINFSIPEAGQVKLVVFDVSGKQVAELVNENLNAGSYNYDFNAASLSSGVYFYRIDAEGFSDVKKMILIK